MVKEIIWWQLATAAPLLAALLYAIRAVNRWEQRFYHCQYVLKRQDERIEVLRNVLRRNVRYQDLSSKDRELIKQYYPERTKS